MKSSQLIEVINSELEIDLPRRTLYDLVDREILKPTRGLNGGLMFSQADYEALHQWLTTPPLNQYKKAQK